MENTMDEVIVWLQALTGLMGLSGGIMLWHASTQTDGELPRALVAIGGLLAVLGAVILAVTAMSLG